MNTDFSDFISKLRNIPPCPDHPKPKYGGCTCMILKFLIDTDIKKETN